VDVLVPSPIETNAKNGPAKGKPLAPLPSSLTNAKIGLLDNSKAGARVITDTLFDHVNESNPDSGPVRVRKLHASLPMSDEAHQELTGTDLVFVGLGDCGSCTSWAIHDAVAIESSGTPTIAVCTTPFELFARAQATVLGFPDLRILVLEHPIAELTDEEVAAKTAQGFDSFDGLLAGDSSGDKSLTVTGPSLLSVDIDPDELPELLTKNKIWDGLPVVPPTPARVDAMLAAYAGDPEQVVGLLPPKYGEITPRLVASICVMAGCKPSYLPVVLAALQAGLQPQFNLNGIQATTHPVAVMTIVSGPITEEIGMNSGFNAFGPGNQANATIGRAVRLCLLAIGGAYPGNGDMATMGSPAKYTYAIAENTSVPELRTLAQARGFGPDDNVVTVVGAEAPQNINDHESKTGLGLLRMIAGTMRGTGLNNSYYVDGEVLVVLSPEHAAKLVSDGYTREQIADYLWHEGRTPISYFSEGNIVQRLQTRFPNEFSEYGAHTLVPVVHEAKNVMLCVLGGAGKHSMFIPSLGATQAASALIER
jgi:hypothetical protein